MHYMYKFFFFFFYLVQIISIFPFDREGKRSESGKQTGDRRREGSRQERKVKTLRGDEIGEEREED